MNILQWICYLHYLKQRSFSFKNINFDPSLYPETYLLHPLPFTLATIVPSSRLHFKFYKKDSDRLKNYIKGDKGENKNK